MKKINLLPCPFCGGDAYLHVQVPEYGLTGAFVKCRRCHARGPLCGVNEFFIDDSGAIKTPATPESIERGKKNAVLDWNLRSATA